MPIVHVRALAPAGGQEQIDRTLTGIATAVAAALDASPRDVWCTYAPIERMTIGTDVVDGDGQIVYVDLLTVPRGDVDARLLVAACTAAASGLGVPIEDVWGIVSLVHPGAAFTGGRLFTG